MWHVASLLLAFSAAGIALADHWGAGAWYGSDAKCELGTIRSECTPEDGFNYYYFDSEISSLVFQTFLNSFVEDYDPVVGIGASMRGTLDSVVDVRMRIYEVPDGKSFWMYTTCAENATISDGTGLYQACKRQLMRVDDTQTGYNSCLYDSFCRESEITSLATQMMGARSNVSATDRAALETQYQNAYANQIEP